MFLKKFYSKMLSVFLAGLFLLTGVMPTKAAPLTSPMSAGVTFIVNSTLDQPDDLTMPGTCHTAANTCTLRAAIMQANRTSGAGATIILPAGTYTLTIPAAGADGEENGDLNLTTPISGTPTITISGAGADNTFIDANQLDRVFKVYAGRTATISDVTIMNGYASALQYGGGIYNEGKLTVTSSTISDNYATTGGGIYTNSVNMLTVTNSKILGNTTDNTGSGGGIYVTSIGAITVTNSQFSANTAGYGGGIHSAGYLAITNSTISGNLANYLGGGIYNNINGLATVSNSTILGNSANDGGGILNAFSMTVKNSTISYNSASLSGGGIVNTSVLNVNNSTISENFANDGGGVHNIGANSIITNSTLAGNQASRHGGGIWSYGDGMVGESKVDVYNTSIVFNAADTDANAIIGEGGGIYNATNFDSIFNLTNSLIAGNSTGSVPVYDDCFGTLYAQGNNLIGAASVSPNGDSCTIDTSYGSYALLNDLSLLGPLQNNGGSTETVALLPGNNAIDNGTSTFFGCIGHDLATLTTDQRGVARPQGSWCDIGAFEIESFSTTFKSSAANDGWILESSENSNIGGSMNSSAANLILGDDDADKQYRAILHFDTSALPDNAVVTSVTLKIKQQGNVVGNNPFSFASLHVDMRNPAFGSSILELVDYDFAAKKVKSAVFNPNPVNGWYSARFNNGGKLYINRTGTTQLRLYFSVDDNNNNIADFIRFFSGNASAGDRPKLLIQYQLP
jgi:hypothetical protein